MKFKYGASDLNSSASFGAITKSDCWYPYPKNELKILDVTTIMAVLICKNLSISTIVVTLVPSIILVEPSKNESKINVLKVSNLTSKKIMPRRTNGVTLSSDCLIHFELYIAIITKKLRINEDNKILLLTLIIAMRITK
jgi:hypothetical protein